VLEGWYPNIAAMSAEAGEEGGDGDEEPDADE